MQLIPGLSEFIQQDVVPGAQAIGSGLSQTKDVLSPSYADAGATRVGDIIRQGKATVANTAQIESVKNKANTQYFSGNDDETNIANASNYERTGKFSDAPKGYDQLYHQSMRAVYNILSDVSKDPVGYITNYVIHKFKFGSPADEARGIAVLSNPQLTGSRTLQGSSAVTRGRKYDMPLDEALKTMRAQGIKVDAAFPRSRNSQTGSHCQCH